MVISEQTERFCDVHVMSQDNKIGTANKFFVLYLFLFYTVTYLQHVI